MDGAPIRLRVLAGAVDVALWLVVGGGAMGGWVWWTSRRTAQPVQTLWEDRQPLVERAARHAWVLQVAVLSLRNVRSPGQRLIGIRTVDARSGGPVSLRSALTRELVHAGYGRLMRLVLIPVRRPMMRQQAETRRQVEAFRAAHPDADWSDPELARMTRGAQVGCARFVATFAASGSLVPLSTRLSPRRQTFADRLAGVVVVRERR